MKRFPKTVFLHRECEGEEGEYLDSSESIASFARAGERIQVGIYELIETVIVAADPVIERKPSKKRR
jgi:hypothetical protein